MSETLASIGEFGLIHRIHKLLQKEKVHSPGVTVGIGDDTASFQPRAGYEVLVTCDCLVEGRHYLPEHITPLDLGRRAMIVNISDIGAMGGQPLYAIISLGLRADTLVTDVETMYRGFTFELKPFNASIIGGNITKMEDAIFINITLIGEVEQGKLMLRSTANPGDVILVTEYLGQAAAGLELLSRAQATEDLHKHPLVRSYITPSHRAREGQAIARSGYATALIDTSDGFLGDLGHICQESNVGAVVIQEKLPISEDLRQAAIELSQDPLELFLKDSDDYELIITCSPDNEAKVRSAIASVSDVSVSEVGRITDATGDIQLMLPDGSHRRLIPSGWDHFAT
ncbi:MAG: thiamine-phosphate kinase [Candidatus Aminicenantes bacterium]|nr:MAG: thiamine-phosphate kinase [Candidatus Aminicenantes bacterium]